MSLSDLASIAVIVQGTFLIVSVVLIWYQLCDFNEYVFGS